MPQNAIALPRCSGMKISPIVAPPRVNGADPVQPDRKRNTISWLKLELTAHAIVNTTKRIELMRYTGWRPNDSDKGPIAKGPMANPRTKTETTNEPRVELVWWKSAITRSTLGAKIVEVRGLHRHQYQGMMLRRYSLHEERQGSHHCNVPPFFRTGPIQGVVRIVVTFPVDDIGVQWRFSRSLMKILFTYRWAGFRVFRSDPNLFAKLFVEYNISIRRAGSHAEVLTVVDFGIRGWLEPKALKLEPTAFLDRSRTLLTDLVVCAEDHRNKSMNEMNEMKSHDSREESPPSRGPKIREPVQFRTYRPETDAGGHVWWSARHCIDQASSVKQIQR
jgi:hypothetical protein